jgi:DNA replication protein DnaC
LTLENTVTHEPFDESLPEPEADIQTMTERLGMKLDMERAVQTYDARKLQVIKQARATNAYFNQIYNGDLMATEPPDGVTCVVCHDARWLRLPLDLGHPQFGQVVECPHCKHLILAERRQELAIRAGLSPWQRTKTFETFRTSRESMAAYNAAIRWSGSPDGWLAIRGMQGSGKTHLALAVCNRLLERVQPCRYYYAADIGAEAKRMMDSGEHHEFLNALKTLEYPIIIDDLGSLRATPWAIQDVLEPMLDARYRRKLPTMFTFVSNTDALREGVSASIARRLEDPNISTVVENGAGQWRS